MPGKVKVRILSGKNLPVMDRSNDTTDAYVEVKLGQDTQKTDICKKSLNPHWNSEWFKFEMDDLELQDEPLQIRVMDHDTYSANDAIGKVYIDLNPLLTNPSKTKEPSGRSMSGWIPVYDTMHGIRGEVNLIVKVELFSDLNKFRQSSCGVKFFFSPNIPEGYIAIQIHGFVEELVVNDDPEYQWIDKIRTPRASNEARQTLFSKLSGEVQRRVGLKALELGGNAVIGYRQCFDLEGESGIVVRGIGTACTLTKYYDPQVSPSGDKEFMSMDDHYDPFLSSKFPNKSSMHSHSKSHSFTAASSKDTKFAERLTAASMPDHLLQKSLQIHAFVESNSDNTLLSNPVNTNSTKLARYLSAPADSSPSLLQPDVELSKVSCEDKDIPVTSEFVVCGTETSPCQKTAFEIDSFVVHKKLRASKKKDRFSTTSLVKRANAAIASEKNFFVSSSERIKEELLKLFHKKQKLSPELQKNESKVRPSPYRNARRKRNLFSLVKKRKSKNKGKGELRRSRSESFSVGRSSVESFPSAQSDDLEFDSDYLRTIDYPRPTDPDSQSFPKIFDRETLLPGSSTRPSLSSESSTTKVAIREAASILQTAERFALPCKSSNNSVRLYISSLDALLVCNPSKEASHSEKFSKVASTSCLVSNQLQIENSMSNTHSDLDLTRRMPIGKICSGIRLSELSSELNTNTDSFSTKSPRNRTVSNAVGNRFTSSNSEYPDLLSSVPTANNNSGVTIGGITATNPSHADSSMGQLQTVISSTTHSTIICTNTIPEERSGSSNDNSVAETHVPLPRKHAHGDNIHKKHISSNPDPKSKLVKAGSTLVTPIDSGSANNLANTSASKLVQQISLDLASTAISIIGRRSSDIDSELSTPPKGLLNSSIQAILSGNHSKGPSFAPSRRPAAGADHFDMLEYPFLTISSFPPKFVQRIGGSVSARSVKLLERISNLDEPESRDSWWTELRMEIRSHARAICCNVILGYEEHTTICDDVCVLSASGTAAIVNSSMLNDLTEISAVYKTTQFVPDTKIDKEKSAQASDLNSNLPNGIARTQSFSGPTSKHEVHETLEGINCTICHIPYSEAGVPFPSKMARCRLCRKGRVPDLLIATIDIPPGTPVCGRSCLIQAQVFRAKRDCKGETSAKEVSDSLPFLEYELHRRLVNKLKVKGMNAIFCLNVQMCVGENLIMAIATGTALCLPGLPIPELPKITTTNGKLDGEKVQQFQKVVQDAYDRNREYYQVTACDYLGQGDGEGSSDEDSEDLPVVNLGTGNKEIYVLEVDDSEDIEIIAELVDPIPDIGIDMNNLGQLMGFEDYFVDKQQMFTQVYRCRIPFITIRHLAARFEKIARCIAFRLRYLKPCVINKLQYRVELPEPDEMQLSITGTALGLKEISRFLNQDVTTIVTHPASPVINKVTEDADMMFNLEYENTGIVPENIGIAGGSSNSSSIHGQITPERGCSNRGSFEGNICNNSASSQPCPSATSTLNRVNSAKTVPIPTSSQTPTSAINVLKNSTVVPFAGSTSPIPLKMSVSPNPTTFGFSNQSIGFPAAAIPPLPSRSRSNSTTYIGGRKCRDAIEITTLSHIPGQKIEKYLGNLNFFFIRETTSFKEMGGPAGFVQNFVMEVIAVLRGHVTALGGNALVSYFMTELSFLHNPHKNQGQCLISVGGDAVLSLPVTSTLNVAEETI